MGWTVEALWAAARVSWGSPHIWPEAQVPFRGEFIPPALSPRLPDCGSSTSAGMPSAASRMGVEALPGAFPGKRGRDCRKPGKIADLTLSSGRGPGRMSPQPSVNYKLEMRQKSGCRPAKMRRIKLALTPLQRPHARIVAGAMKHADPGRCGPAGRTSTGSRSCPTGHAPPAV